MERLVFRESNQNRANGKAEQRGHRNWLGGMMNEAFGQIIFDVLMSARRETVMRGYVYSSASAKKLFLKQKTTAAMTKTCKSEL